MSNIKHLWEIFNKKNTPHAKITNYQSVICFLKKTCQSQDINPSKPVESSYRHNAQYPQEDTNMLYYFWVFFPSHLHSRVCERHFYTPQLKGHSYSDLPGGIWLANERDFNAPRCIKVLTKYLLLHKASYSVSHSQGAM